MSCSHSTTTSEVGQHATVQLFGFFLWCFSFLSGGLVHSSKNTNIAAQLSTGLSGVNFTAGRTKAYNCSGIVCYPGHAYSVAGPWASAPCPKPNPQLFTCFFLFPHSILFLFIPRLLLPFVSFPFHMFLKRGESRGDWLVRLKLRGRPGLGLEAQGAPKAGRIGLNCCFKCP